MKLEAKREDLLKPLQAVIGVVERRQTQPVLANVLTVASEGTLSLTATDHEVELTARVELPIGDPGETTLPARKLFEILRALPEEAMVSVSVEDDKAQVRCGRSRFSLITLPAAEFPSREETTFDAEVRLTQEALKALIERTHFAMAQQDVRYYLNGLLLETHAEILRAVATDGHRLALCDAAAESEAAEPQQVILPRKGVQELLRLLDEGEALVRIGTNQIQVTLGDIRFTSKLIDGKFPDYQRVIPKTGERRIVADRVLLRSALNRAAILSNDKYRGVRLQATDNILHIQSHNPEQEEAEEELEVEYSGTALEIGFNVTYLLDALGALCGDKVQLSFTDANSSCLLQETDAGTGQYVVMPMRL